ncbi:MAG: YceI family protein [Bacteroidia bacterium]
MKNLFTFLSLGLVLVLTAYGAVSAWKINAQGSSVVFSIKNAGLNTEGSFTGLQGSISFDPQNPGAGKITASVDAASINTGISMRDKDLRSDEYLDVEKYPRISFTSTSIEKTGEGYKVTGNFKVKDVTRSVAIPFTFEKQVFKGKFSVNRLDYGVGKKSWVMGDEVKISFEIAVNTSGS